MMHTRKRVAAGLTAIALFALGAACSADSTGREPGDKSVAISVPEDLVTLDPAKAVGAYERSALRFAYDTLIGRTSDGDLVPQLAESWESTPAGITLVLRNDVTCSDGTPLTAATVAENFERLKDPESAPLTSSYLGSREYAVSFDADARSVTLQLPEPFGVLATHLSHYPGIVCQAGLDDPDSLQVESSGTGPFTLASASSGDRWVFERREGYAWGPDGASNDAENFPEEVILRVVANETTATNLLLGGELDVAPLTEVEAGRVESAGIQFELVEVPHALHALWFNHTESGAGILDVDVRRALAAVIDRSSLSEIAVGTDEAVHDSATALPLSRCAPGVPSEAVVRFGPEGAEEILRAAGWSQQGSGWAKDGKPLKLRLLVSGNSGSPARIAGESVANSWREFGVELDVRTVDQSSFVDAVETGDWDVLLRGWTSLFDPGMIVPEYTNPDSVYKIWLDNPEYDQLVTKANLADEQTRCDLYNEADAAVAESVSAFPLFYSSQVFATTGVQFESYMSLVDPVSLRVTG
jgi:peptide/nickel transport system substrate-binding protein